MKYKLLIPLFLFLLLFTSCSTGPVDTESWHGKYVLEEIDGMRVPGLVEHDGVDMYVKQGELRIFSDNTCVTKSNFSVQGNPHYREVTCDYRQQGDTLMMQWRGAGTTTGTLSPGRFVMDNHGAIFSYRQQ